MPKKAKCYAAKSTFTRLDRSSISRKLRERYEVKRPFYCDSKKRESAKSEKFGKAGFKASCSHFFESFERDHVVWQGSIGNTRGGKSPSVGAISF